MFIKKLTVLTLVALLATVSVHASLEDTAKLYMRKTAAATCIGSLGYAGYSFANALKLNLDSSKTKNPADIDVIMLERNEYVSDGFVALSAALASGVIASADFSQIVAHIDIVRLFELLLNSRKGK